MKQYVDLLKRILDEGVWVENKRTGTKCLTVLNETFRYNVGKGEFPLLTTRKVNYRGAIGEMLAYMRGYTKLEDFHKLGVKTWDANATAKHWMESIYNPDPGNSVGLIYGAAGNEVPHIEYSRLNGPPHLIINPIQHKYKILKSIIEKIKEGNDDRGLIWNFWNPSLFHLGCLRPCMYLHHFSILDDTLHLTSHQRSTDTTLGLSFNMVQCYFLLWAMAKLTGKEPGIATHHMVNIHIYDNQYPVLLENKQYEREPYPSPSLVCHKPITYESVFGLCENEEDNLHPNDFEVMNYQYHPPIKYPFTV